MKRQWIAAGCAAVLCSGSAWAFDLATPAAVPAGNYSSVVAVGDLNGDQLDDVALATRTINAGGGSEEHIFLYLQKGDGTLATPLDVLFSATDSNADIALGDFNRDGIADVVVCGAAGLMVVSKQGANFTSGVIPGAPACGSVAVLDADHDGNLDIVVQASAGNAAIYYGEGTGAFPRHTSLGTGGGGSAKLVAGDLNGDGMTDLVLFDYTTIVVYLQASAGGFVAHPLANPTDVWGVGAAVVGDLNHDGRQDLALAQNGNVPTSAVWLYAQASNGTLLDPVRVPTGDIPTGLVASDLDRDGRTDLLAGHGGWGIGFHLQGVDGLADEVRDRDVRYSEGAHALAAGDIDDDGCMDAVIVENGANGLKLLRGQNCVRGKARSDFDGDGVSDALWRNAATGANAIWKSADPTRQIGMPAVDLGWRIVATGDFNGDGQADLLWHRDSDGSSAIWYSAKSTGAAMLTRVTDTAWSIVGAGDFNGDGQADVLWRHATSGRNAVWLSGNAATQISVATVTDTQWKIVGVDDFDGDGKADILWRHDTTGANGVWPSADYTLRRTLTGVADRAWVVGGTGDFDGDGKADIFWRHTGTGANVIWRAANAATTMPVSRGGLGWQVVVGDYTGDRKADLLWRNPATGEDVLWRAAQASVQKDVTDVTSTAWRLAP